MTFSRPAPAHSWIRSNVLGMVAIFIALSGTAVAAQVASHPGAHKAKKKAKAGPAGPTGPAGPAGAQGQTGLTGPSTGTAGGELAGSYPNPSVGTVNGLDLASHNGAAGGIHFGNDIDLYRSQMLIAPLALVTNQVFGSVAGNGSSGAVLTPSGDMGLFGSTPGTGTIQLTENGPFADPGSNNVKIGLRDNGSGATQLVAVFPGGDVVPLATDPTP
jgi:hypothetical protein